MVDRKDAMRLCSRAANLVSMRSDVTRSRIAPSIDMDAQQNLLHAYLVAVIPATSPAEEIAIVCERPRSGVICERPSVVALHRDRHARLDARNRRQHVIQDLLRGRAECAAARAHLYPAFLVSE